MYWKGYNRLFWGIIITIFHINIGYINIIPDFIGYILIYSGLNILALQHKVYEKAKMPAALLVLLTLKDIWNDPNNNILTGQIYKLSLATLIISTLVAIIKLYLIYLLCNGIYEICKERGLEEIMSSAKNIWKNYFFVALAYLIYAPFSINLEQVPRIIIIIIIGVIQIVISISLALMLKKCRVELET